ncbi:MAG: adenylate/guanylate cyclase domain-containing protein [Smithella sp.]
MKEFINKHLQATPLKITILVILLTLVLFFFDFAFLRFMELKTLDLRIASRGTLPAGPETVIASIDEKSLNELGRWPWPRATIKALVDRLKASGAKAIGFDIVFSESNKAASDADAALAGSISRAKNTTLGYFFHLSDKDVAHLSEKEIAEHEENIKNSRYQLVNCTEKNADDTPLPKAYAPQTNLKFFSTAAVNSGFFNIIPDTDGSLRWAPLVIKFGGNYYSSLPISVLQQYLDWPQLSLNLAGYGTESIIIGDTVIPTDESGRLLINYLGPVKTFPHFSVSDILQGRIPAEKIRDKIVLVGATAIGIYDVRVTPFGAAYPGVEIHATVIDNILHRNFLIHSGFTRFIDLCTIILAGLLMGLIIPRLKAVKGIFAAVMLIGAFVAANVFLFSSFNIWLNLVYPILTMLTVYLGITVYSYITEEREKKKIRGAFQYYLTPSVINEMLKDPSKLKLGGDKKDLSVLFSDIRGFTTISEKLGPEELVHLLNEYLTAMTDIVFKYDGTLDKYMGDAIMAIFGAPLEQPDHARRACRTALDMMSELHRLQKKWREEGKQPLNIGIGINSGEMVVGNMGSQMRFDYTVMGDMVNLGSRLEGTNKEYGTSIIISEFTYNAVRDSMCCRELDWVRVKGKKLPVKIYELLGEKKDELEFKEFISSFEEGLAFYRAFEWDEAIAAFQKTLSIQPEDTASTLYIGRCRNLKENAPPTPWDGVFTMTGK